MNILYYIVIFILIIYFTYKNLKLRDIKGPEGPRGDVGDEGKQGYKGTKGAVGIMGNTGLRGRRGDAYGEQGPTGYPGYIGPPGEKGFKGYRGYKGFKGDSGERGRRGNKGRVGNAGSDGPRGFNGEYIYNQIDENSCKFIPFNKDREVKCPYGHVLTGIKNELDNYEGKCCKFKVSGNCKDFNLSTQLLDHKEEMVGTPNESKYLTYEEQEIKNMFSDKFGKNYLPLYYLNNNKCQNLNRILVQCYTSRFQINKNCIEDDILLDICKVDKDNFKGIKKGFVFEDNKFVDVYSLLDENLKDIYLSAQLKVVNKNPDLTDIQNIIEFNIENSEDNKSIIFISNEYNFDYELKLVDVFYKEESYFNDLVRNKIFVTLPELGDDPIPVLAPSSNTINESKEIKDFFEFKNDEYTDIHKLFLDNYLNFVTNAKMKLIGNKDSRTLLIKLSVPKDKSPSSIIFDFDFNLKNQKIELDLVTSFIPDNLIYLDNEKLFENDNINEYVNFKADRWMNDLVVPKLYGSHNKFRCCSNLKNEINKFIDFNDLTKLENQIIGNLDLEWEKIKDFMIDFPDIEENTYKVIKRIINGRNIMPLKNKEGSYNIITVENINDFKEFDENAYIISDTYGDLSDIKIFMLSMKFDNLLSTIPAPIYVDNNSSTPNYVDNDRSPESNKKRYKILIYEIEKNFSNFLIEDIEDNIDFSNLTTLNTVNLGELNIDWELVKSFMFDYPNVDDETFSNIKEIIKQDTFEPLKYDKKYLKVINVKQFNYEDKEAYVISEIDKNNIKIFIIKRIDEDILDLPNTIEYAPDKINLLNIKKSEIENTINSLKYELENLINNFEIIDNTYAGKTSNEWINDFSIFSMRTVYTLDSFLSTLDDIQKIELNLLIESSIWNKISFYPYEIDRIIESSKSTKWHIEINEKELELEQINIMLEVQINLLNSTVNEQVPTTVTTQTPASYQKNYSVVVKRINRNFAINNNFLIDRFNLVVNCRVYAFTINNKNESSFINLDMIPPAVKKKPISNNSILSNLCRFFYELNKNGHPKEDLKNTNYGSSEIVACSIFFDYGTLAELNITQLSTYTKVMPINKNTFDTEDFEIEYNKGYTIIFDNFTINSQIFNDELYTLYKIKTDDFTDNKNRYLKLC